MPDDRRCDGGAHGPWMPKRRWCRCSGITASEDGASAACVGVAPACKELRSGPNKSEREPTSARSTNYGSGHLSPAFHGTGHIFSSLYPFCFLIALPPHRDLLLSAKHLFVPAIRQPSRGFRTSQSRPNCHRSPVARTRFKVLIYLKRFGAGACGALVSTSKVLAQMNKT